MRNDPQVLDKLRSRATPDGLLQVQERDGRTHVRGLGAGHTRAGSINAETFTIDALVSTNELDRYDTIIEPDGWDLANFEKNPVVFFNHEDRETPIGKCVSIAKMSNGLLARTLFATGYRMAANLGLAGSTTAGSIDRRRVLLAELRALTDRMGRLRLDALARAEEVMATQGIA